ncbi:MAG: hypothetical protein RIT27_745 [Pseudomonadota bacterium]|jgi:hypothetical protein
MKIKKVGVRLEMQNGKVLEGVVLLPEPQSFAEFINQTTPFVTLVERKQSLRILNKHYILQITKLDVEIVGEKNLEQLFAESVQ